MRPAGKRRKTKSSLLALLLTPALLLTGCPKPVPDTVLAQARQWGDEYKWEDARPLIKSYLIDHPDDVSGHFLLGRSYMGIARPYLTQAIGELRMAEELARAGGSLGVYSDQTVDQLLSTIFQEVGRAHMRRFLEGMNAGFPPQTLKGFLEEALSNVKRGLELQPDSAFLKGMQETLLDNLMDLQGQEPNQSQRPGSGVV